jgi:hypothetical protein
MVQMINSLVMEIVQLLSKTNWLAILVVTVISFPLGALWHSSLLFGRPWKEDANPKFDLVNKWSFAKLFGLAAILHFVGSLGLSLVIGSHSTAFSGLLIGFGASTLWVFTSISVTHLFAGRSLRLCLIDSGFYIFFYSIAGLILGGW